jgi:hypothetical protein
MKIEYFLYIGGIFHLAWVLFDSLWPWLFNWKISLRSLDDFHQVLVPIISKLLIVIYLGFAYISFFHTLDLISTDLGRTLLFFISIFWTVRAALQVYYMGFNKANKFNVSLSSFVNVYPLTKVSNRGFSYYFLSIFIVMVILYSIPLVCGTV